MNILKALSKQLFGAKYERLIKCPITCLILFLVVRTAGIKVTIAPSILFLTAAALSAGIMWQALTSAYNEDVFLGLFMLPFGNGNMVFSVMLAFIGYTLITKTFLVLTLFFAVHEWSAAQIAVSLLCACSGCFMAAAVYIVTRQKKPLPLDAYVFYRPVSARHLRRHVGKSESVFRYLSRYLLTNRNYLWDTAGLCVIAVFLPAILGQFEGLNVMPIGFAILCLNTPICILLSCDPDLERAVRVLPRQTGRFCTRYCLFICLVNMTVMSVYLASWQIRHGGVAHAEITTALLFALQSAILSGLLEWLRPIRNWKMESDLWHHPRKYLVTLVMLLIAGLVSIWPVCIWVLLCIVLAEVLSLPLIARRGI